MQAALGSPNDDRFVPPFCGTRAEGKNEAIALSKENLASQVHWHWTPIGAGF